MTAKVLIVDDQPEVTRAIHRALYKEPYDLLCANSANEALDMMTRQTVDVVISDEKMPGISGTEFLRQVSEKYPRTVRMMLTGNANLGETVRAINEGKVYHYFTKPWNDEDLMVTIRQALEQEVST